MYKTYLKQVFAMLRENKLLSVISILGTALAICMIMVIVITYQMRIDNYSPEDNRDRSLYVRWAGRTYKEQQKGNGYLSLRTIKECFLPLKTPEAVSFISPCRSLLASLPGGKERKDCLMMFTDDVFWKVFNFEYLSGSPYTAEEVSSGIRKAVISESIARRLYGTTEAAGRTIMISYKPYTVSGVVKDISTVAKFSYADVWIPYSASPVNLSDDAWAENITGWFQVIILAHSAADFPAIRQEISNLQARYNSSLNDYRLVLYNQPDTQLELEIKGERIVGPDKKRTILQYILVILILLLVPAINLSGMTLSRMRSRLSEIGIRKAFGATKSRLLVQILSENLFLTLLGGAVGLILSYLAVYVLRTWLLGSSFGSISSVFGGVPVLSVGELLNPIIFLYAFLFCLILNLLSAGIPAYRMSRKDVVEALNEY